ncbi:MAG: hypothetical protein R2942_12565 [Ignavibacteria bacterium]
MSTKKNNVCILNGTYQANSFFHLMIITLVQNATTIKLFTSRGGYQFTDQDNTSDRAFTGLTFGAGLNYNARINEYRIDYAYEGSESFFDNNQHFTVISDSNCN